MARAVGQQVAVITGASSGIGREVALQFARAGAAVALVARDVIELERVAGEIEQTAGRCMVAPADVTDEAAMLDAARKTVERFGRIDTWVNNTGVGQFGTVEQTDPAELRRILDTNVIGTFNGTKAALPHLKASGGTLINIGSVESVVSIPLQGAYAASKHAVRGLTDALREELAHEGSAVTVTLILPSSIDTPYYHHAPSHLPTRPAPPGTVYDPASVARAVLFAATHRRREIVVGGAGKALVTLKRISPSLTDLALRAIRIFRQQRRPGVPDAGQSNLHTPMGGPTRGGFSGRRSLSLPLTEQYPVAQSALAVALAALGGLVVWRLLDMTPGARYRDDSPLAAGPLAHAHPAGGDPPPHGLRRHDPRLIRLIRQIARDLR